MSAGPAGEAGPAGRRLSVSAARQVRRPVPPVSAGPRVRGVSAAPPDLPGRPASRPRPAPVSEDPLTLVADFALMPARIGLALLGHGIALSRGVASAVARRGR